MVGMNPGPFGMAQTGVPFGDVAMVRDFLGITGEVGKPPRENRARPRRVRVPPLGGERHPLLGLGARPLRHAPSASSTASSSRTGARSCSWRTRGETARPDKLPAAERGAALPTRATTRSRGSSTRCSRRSWSASAASPSSAAREALGDDADDRVHPPPEPCEPGREPRLGGLVDAQLESSASRRLGSVAPCVRRPSTVELMLLATVLLWALNLSVTKYILSTGSQPLPYATIRYGLAALIFVALDALRRADAARRAPPPAGAGGRGRTALPQPALLRVRARR